MPKRDSKAKKGSSGPVPMSDFEQDFARQNGVERQRYTQYLSTIHQHHLRKGTSPLSSFPSFPLAPTELADMEADVDGIRHCLERLADQIVSLLEKKGVPAAILRQPKFALDLEKTYLAFIPKLQAVAPWVRLPRRSPSPWQLDSGTGRLALKLADWYISLWVDGKVPDEISHLFRTPEEAQSKIGPYCLFGALILNPLTLWTRDGVERAHSVLDPAFVLPTTGTQSAEVPAITALLSALHLSLDLLTSIDLKAMVDGARHLSRMPEVWRARSDKQATITERLRELVEEEWQKLPSRQRSQSQAVKRLVQRATEDPGWWRDQFPGVDEGDLPRADEDAIQRRLRRRC